MVTGISASTQRAVRTSSPDASAAASAYPTAWSCDPWLPAHDHGRGPTPKTVREPLQRRGLQRAPGRLVASFRAHTRIVVQASELWGFP